MPLEINISTAYMFLFATEIKQIWMPKISIWKQARLFPPLIIVSFYYDSLFNMSTGS